jgi:hypothetical protein
MKYEKYFISNLLYLINVMSRIEAKIDKILKNDKRRK